MSEQQSSTDVNSQGAADVVEEIKNEVPGVAGVDSQSEVTTGTDILESQNEESQGEVTETIAEAAVTDAGTADVAEPGLAEELPIAEIAAVNPGAQDASIEQPAVEPIPAIVPEVAPVVATVQTPSTGGQDTSENKEYLDNIRENGTVIQKQALDALDQFCTRMRPRAPITAVQAMEAQRDLLDFMTVLLRKDYEDFRKGWSTMLVYFAEHHGDRPTAKDYTALSEYSTSRHLDSWKDEDRAGAYNNLLTLLRVTRNSNTRKQDVKRIRLDMLAPTFLNARCMDNLQRFYA